MGIEHSKHIFRVFILLAIVIAGAFVLRILFVPHSFGRYGHYRADALADNAAIEVRHGGDEGCGECHGEEKEAHDGGPHGAVPCEDCHDALASHVKDGQKIADMQRTKSVTRLCARCHRELVARPAGFPQVNIEAHVEEMGAELSDEVCFECHSPHDPTP